MKDVVIVIPSLEPSEKLLKLLSSIRNLQPELPIVTVNDGSSSMYDKVFNKVENVYKSKVLVHKFNMGKGTALKTAFHYILDYIPEAKYIVTIDSDGQHNYSDMMHCIQSAKQHPGSLILGTRNFDKNVPLRSKLGNVLTRNIFRLTTGIHVTDTQTGLRVIPIDFIDSLLKVDGDRFEYEMNMLMEAKKRNWNIYSQPISTIYIEDNASSHFRAIRDSVAIYWIFIKYLLSSVTSFLVDVAAYAILIRLLAHISLSSIMAASVLARAISSIFNYYVNRELVFTQRTKHSFFKYFGLVICQITASALLVYLLHLLLPVISTVFLKIAVDSLLFFLSFYIQKNYVFKGEKS
ncbi:glycosyltransferase [Oceanobacillus oncorhynchi subsp. oncorhynchi]|uniref:glycosyltransferase n=1 Tax=Oceanobacillus TaxID=182709 RepID=UPI0030DBB2DD